MNIAGNSLCFLSRAVYGGLRCQARRPLRCLAREQDAKPSSAEQYALGRSVEACAARLKNFRSADGVPATQENPHEFAMKLSKKRKAGCAPTALRRAVICMMASKDLQPICEKISALQAKLEGKCGVEAAVRSLTLIARDAIRCFVTLLRAAAPGKIPCCPRRRRTVREAWSGTGGTVGNAIAGLD